MQKDKDYADLKAKIAELERMAEKKNVDIAYQEDLLIKSGTALSVVTDQLEAAQTTLEKYRAAVEDRINEKEDLMWKNQELQAELERVKAVAEKMASRLKLIGIGEDVLTEYQNLKQ